MTLALLTPTFGAWKCISRDKEARLQQVATGAGKDPTQLIEEAVDRMLEYDARLIEAVEEGRASARRGDLLEHEEVLNALSRCSAREASEKENPQSITFMSRLTGYNCEEAISS